MVFTELKPQFEQLPHEKRIKELALLKHLLRSEIPSTKTSWPAATPKWMPVAK